MRNRAMAGSLGPSRRSVTALPPLTLTIISKQLTATYTYLYHVIRTSHTHRFCCRGSDWSTRLRRVVHSQARKSLSFVAAGGYQHSRSTEAQRSGTANYTRRCTRRTRTCGRSSSQEHLRHRAATLHRGIETVQESRRMHELLDNQDSLRTVLADGHEHPSVQECS